jgi:hypothetical protein
MHRDNSDEIELPHEFPGRHVPAKDVPDFFKAVPAIRGGDGKLARLDMHLRGALLSDRDLLCHYGSVAMMAVTAAN